MKTVEKFFVFGGAMVLAVSIAQCGSGNTNNMTGDMAMPSPVVTAVSPAAAVNNASTPLTITGTNFRAGATVTVGGVACTQATVVSATQITCTYPGKAATCGGQAIVVTHPDDMKMGTLPAAMGVMLRSTTLGFAAATTLAAGTTPDRVVAADFNSDGKIDLANTNRGGTVQFRLGNGDGTFQAPTNVAAGLGSAIGLTVVDLNMDGKPDLVSATGGSNISVILNNGAGAFAAPVNSAIAGNPVDVQWGDFNGDGKPDLAMALNTGNAAAIRLGDGKGGFLASPPANVMGGTTPQNVVVGDFNGDKMADIAFTSFVTSTVILATGKGDGTFNAVTNLTTVTNPVGVMIVDANSDGKLDLLVGANAGTNVALHLGNGNGTFAAAVNQTTGTGPRFTALADIDGDGKVDFVSANSGPNNVSLRLGNGTAFTGGATQDYAVGMAPFSVAVGDFNGDGTNDMVSANNGSDNLSVLLQQCK